MRLTQWVQGAARLNHRRAFSLIETLVAVALFGAAVMALMMAVGNLTRGLVRAGSSSEIGFHREFVLRAALAKKTRDEVASGGELTMPDGRRIHWSATLTPAETVDLHRLELRFNPNDDAASAEVCIHTLAYKPEWGDAVARSTRIAAKRAALGADRIEGDR